MSAATRPLGRKTPLHFDHVEAYPLRDEDTPTFRTQPVAPGTNWYSGFDTPVKGSDGKYRWPSKKLGTIRGGHCYCLCPPERLHLDTEALRVFYNQLQEPACEGFGHGRRFSLIYGDTFDPLHLYDDARRAEDTYPSGEGSTNEAVCKALAKWGVHEQVGPKVAERASLGKDHEGTVKKISTYRWATNVDQILTVLGITDGGEIPMLQSWGPDDYPDVTYVDPAVMERLLRESGECDVLTDA